MQKNAPRFRLTGTRLAFWVGALVRVLAVPFLLQWFHPDERQMLEFAHFHAHGSLHPFLESALHLRNQSFPWIVSLLVRLCDGVGLASPRAYLIAMHLLIGAWSWWGLWALVEYLRLSAPKSERAVTGFAWFVALFWPFPFLYSRALLEVISLPSTFLLLLEVKRGRLGRAGFWAGVTSVLRYPSALWAVGAALVVARERFVLRRSVRWRQILAAAAGFALALFLGGLADRGAYGAWLDSALRYWEFNRPHGPVEKIFGSDSLAVYWHWFEFILTPWLAPLFLLASAYALLRSPELLLFALPYVIAHVWTPHREPRFMIPLTPLLALAVAEALAKGEPLLTRVHGWIARIPALRFLALAHIALNFLWYPLYAFAQWNSAQGILVRNYRELAHEPARFVTLSDPVIDALIPRDVVWSDRQCRWERPEFEGFDESPVWVLAAAPPAPNCSAEAEPAPFARSGTFQRLLRVRVAALYDCPPAVLATICPSGVQDAPKGYPYASSSGRIEHALPADLAKRLSE